jgi:hypothetical protein
MSVRVVRPENWKTADFVEVESDAATNAQALIELDSWAAENRFLRVVENWLRPFLNADGKKAYRAICYRPTQEDLASTEARIRAREDSVARQSQLH